MINIPSDHLWGKLVGVKYGEWVGRWLLQPVFHSYGFVVWKAIREGWESFVRFVGYGVGDGRQIRFWHDAWCVDRNLASLYLESFQIFVKVEELALILGCRLSKLPIKYLGMPLSAKFKAQEIWNPILEKMEKRLAGGGRKFTCQKEVG